MKRGLVILFASLGVAVAGFFAMRALPSAASKGTLHRYDGDSHLPELEWLRREFNLNDTEFTQVASLHRGYLPTCETLCERVEEARGKVRGLVLAGTAVTPELEAALREEAALRAECQTAMLRHLYETAGVLPPAKARSYLDAMLPEVLAMAMEPAERHGGH